jgi:hypothetical protein
MRNRLLSFAILSALSVRALCAQQASDLNSGLTISHDSSLDEFALSWWGINDFYYFVLGTEELVDEPWVYFPYANKGTDAVLGPPPFATNAPKMFFRLEYTDDPASDLLTSDFDGDFVSNKAELDQGTDVYNMLFGDADQLPDEWELFHFGDLFQSDSGNGDSDGLTNLEESRTGGDPNVTATLTTAAAINLSIYSPR